MWGGGRRRFARDARAPLARQRHAAADAHSQKAAAGYGKGIRRFLPLVLVALVLATLAALLYRAFASVEWGLEPRDLWFLLVPLGIAAGGYWWGRWKALLVLGAFPWLALALLLDAAWMTGIWDRSDEYEPLPSTPFVFIFGVPAFAGLVALGVAMRKAVGANGQTTIAARASTHRDAPARD